MPAAGELTIGGTQHILALPRDISQRRGRHPLGARCLPDERLGRGLRIGLCHDHPGRDRKRCRRNGADAVLSRERTGQAAPGTQRNPARERRREIERHPAGKAVHRCLCQRGVHQRGTDPASGEHRRQVALQTKLRFDLTGQIVEIAGRQAAIAVFLGHACEQARRTDTDHQRALAPQHRGETSINCGAATPGHQPQHHLPNIARRQIDPDPIEAPVGKRRITPLAANENQQEQQQQRRSFHFVTAPRSPPLIRLVTSAKASRGAMPPGAAR